ncbi:GTP-binding protein, putative [Plasmodium vivax]|uniref:GTP-binding protein, putative n=6 Tax=Plasmodium vivax TaxID=5855 RepID=A5K9M3_PLAVS|nr:GTP-binding protein, putative [Plasmodium vivax]KMZ80032.1 GTP-binding protein [Plasmodium vivax India VII]KMZ86324.1 GTP-binding protein [Plasmodium vivax Brazil I]KMZ92684.1 GTP-binding protein [Plasmodium vivax Mauritania I]KMZ99233.1 GTP-binding protein [Plasmodium vivax North Korean]EDL44095.1 GTP-binding protein, putative [Plasmodium vivax]|eukprot:XP_001613822.1 GTP-binding protein [Plasmodium vivax Sal-1]
MDTDVVKMIRKAALSLFKEEAPAGTPYLAKPFLNINFLNEEELPFWLTDEKHIKKCNSIFNSKIVAYPVYVAQTIHKYRPSAVPQVAIFGRSNVGKSSLINALLNNREVAQASKTPGRTRHLFIFNLLNHLSIVDLPGYGFAKVAKHMRDDWSVLIEEYLNRAVNLKRALCLIECTEFFTPHDFVLLDMLITKGVPFQIVVTKVDRLRAHELHKLMVKVLSVIEDYKKKVNALNERTHRQSLSLHKEVPHEMNISSYLFNVSSLRDFGVQPLRAHLGLIATDEMVKKK